MGCYLTLSYKGFLFRPLYSGWMVPIVRCKQQLLGGLLMVATAGVGRL
jgi:hypothetical protein